MYTKANKAYRIIFALLKALACAGAGALSFSLLYRYEYVSQFFCIDNFVGFLPVALSVCGFGAVVACLCIERKKTTAAACACLFIAAVLCYSLFPNALKCNWWISYDQPLATENEPELDIYAPFEPDNVLATVDDEHEILTRELPQLDGAVALYPVYAAIAQEFYDRDAFFAEGGYAENTYENNGERVIMTNTLRAYDGLIDGERDIIFVAGASQSQKDRAKAAGVELVFTPIGKEAFVFIVPESNPINGITYQQIKNVYSGKTALWRTLGWADGGSIVSFRRPDGSGSQTGLQNIMKDVPLTVTQPLPDRALAGSNSLMTQMTVEYKGVQPALGYSYKYYATKMYKNDGTKLLAVDGIYPSAENIASGLYPFTVEFYAVTSGAPQGNSKKLIDLILSDAGQSLVAATGYSPIRI